MEEGYDSAWQVTEGNLYDLRERKGVQCVTGKEGGM